MMEVEDFVTAAGVTDKMGSDLTGVPLRLDLLILHQHLIQQLWTKSQHLLSIIIKTELVFTTSVELQPLVD